MHPSRRSFIQKAGLIAAAVSANSWDAQLQAAQLDELTQRYLATDDKQVASDEDYWAVIQQAYSVNPSIINLNNGGVSPAPSPAAMPAARSWTPGC